MLTIFRPEHDPTLDDPAFTDARVREQVLRARAKDIVRACASGQSFSACEEFAYAWLALTAQESDRYATARRELDARR